MKHKLYKSIDCLFFVSPICNKLNFLYCIQWSTFVFVKLSISFYSRSYNFKKIHNTKVNTQYTVDLCILWNQPASTALVSWLTFELSMAQCSYTLKTIFNALSYRSTKVYGKLSCLADTNTLWGVSMERARDPAVRIIGHNQIIFSSSFSLSLSSPSTL